MMKMNQYSNSNRPNKRRKKSNDVSLSLYMRLNFYTTILKQLISENETLAKLIGKHLSMNLQFYSIDEHIKLLEENLRWSKVFSKNSLIRKIYNSASWEDCETCEIFKKNIHEITLLSSCLKLNGVDLNGEEALSSLCKVTSSVNKASKESGFICKFHESSAISSDTAPVASSTKSHDENSECVQKTSNIYPPTYVQFLEEKLCKRTKKSIFASEKHSEVSRAKESCDEHSCSDEICILEIELLNVFEQFSTKNGNSGASEFNTMKFTISSSQSKRNYVNSNSHNELNYNSSVLKKNCGNSQPKVAEASCKSTSCKYNRKKHVMNLNPSKSKKSVSILSNHNSRITSAKVRASELIERPLRRSRSAVKKLNFKSSFKFIGPAEISQIKKDPKLQPIVKLVDIYKSAHVPYIPQAKKFDSIDSRAISSTDCEKILFVSSLETTEGMNVVAEKKSRNSEQMMEEVCLDKTMEVELGKKDHSSVKESQLSEENNHETHEKELSFQEEEKSFGAKLKKNNNLDSNRAKHDFLDLKSVQNADSAVEMSDLNQMDSSAAERHFSPMEEPIWFPRGPRTPPDFDMETESLSPGFICHNTETESFGPRYISHTPDDSEIGPILTPRSPPTPDRFPSSIEPCCLWPSPSRRGPRTPPGAPKTPEVSDDEYT